MKFDRASESKVYRRRCGPNNWQIRQKKNFSDEEILMMENCHVDPWDEWKGKICYGKEYRGKEGRREGRE